MFSGLQDEGLSEASVLSATVPPPLWFGQGKGGALSNVSQRPHALMPSGRVSDPPLITLKDQDLERHWNNPQDAGLVPMNSEDTYPWVR